MASDMLIALVDTSLKGQVYRERYDAGIEGSTEGNFVCRAIFELSEFGVFVRTGRMKRFVGCLAFWLMRRVQDGVRQSLVGVRPQETSVW